MLEEGIRGDTISYTAVINACAKAGDVKRAEHWLVQMLKDGVEPNIITFNAVISACTKDGQGDLAMHWLDKMKRAGVAPNSFSYNSAARSFATSGDYRKVEQLMESLRADGMSPDDFCIASLLNAYANARPKQSRRAEAAFEEFVKASPNAVSTNTVAALARATSRSAADAFCKKCGLNQKALEAANRA